MSLRERFGRSLDALRDDVLAMASLVENELDLALRALETRDPALAGEVRSLDHKVNQARFDIEQTCVGLLVTQQPAARDLRSVVAAMNMITDLERMGDQAKGIATVVRHLQRTPAEDLPPEIAQMGHAVKHMLRETMLAYAHDNVPLARTIAAQEEGVDRLYTRVFQHILKRTAEVGEADTIEAVYLVLRAARELERFGDLASNLAERVIYMVTGSLETLNADDVVG